MSSSRCHWRAVGLDRRRRRLQAEPVAPGPPLAGSGLGRSGRVRIVGPVGCRAAGSFLRRSSRFRVVGPVGGGVAQGPANCRLPHGRTGRCSGRVGRVSTRASKAVGIREPHPPAERARSSGSVVKQRRATACCGTRSRHSQFVGPRRPTRLHWTLQVRQNGMPSLNSEMPQSGSRGNHQGA